ncbi:hypothetical protein RI367_002698 [Sorochytrium milnesiophthora]
MNNLGTSGRRRETSTTPAKVAFAAPSVANHSDDDSGDSGSGGEEWQTEVAKHIPRNFGPLKRKGNVASWSKQAASGGRTKLLLFRVPLGASLQQIAQELNVQAIAESVENRTDQADAKHSVVCSMESGFEVAVAGWHYAQEMQGIRVLLRDADNGSDDEEQDSFQDRPVDQYYTILPKSTIPHTELFKAGEAVLAQPYEVRQHPEETEKDRPAFRPIGAQEGAHKRKAPATQQQQPSSKSKKAKVPDADVVMTEVAPASATEVAPKAKKAKKSKTADKNDKPAADKADAKAEKKSKKSKQ